MFVRKLVKMGKSSCVVSLPKAWVEGNRLDPGAHIYIEELPDGALRLNGREYQREAKATAIKLGKDMSRDELRRTLISKYLNGYEFIQLNSDGGLNPRLLEETTKVVDMLIGLEIVEEDLKKVVLECLIKPNELPVDKILRRMYLLTKSMHQDSMNVLQEGKVNLAETIIDRDHTVNRLYFLGIRYLHMVEDPEFYASIELSSRDGLDYQSIFKRIERVGDFSKSMAKYVQRLDLDVVPKNLLDDVRGINGRINRMYEKAVTSFFKNDFAAANSVIDEREIVKDELKDLVHRTMELKADVALNLALILENALSIANCCADIAEVVIDRSDLR